MKITDIKKYHVNVLFMGDDWAGKFDLLPCETIYLKRTELISSSIIKEVLDKNSIKYKINKNETEILVKNKDHKDIATLITTNINVPEDIVHMLIKFTVSGDEKDKLYIRIKFK